MRFLTASASFSAVALLLSGCTSDSAGSGTVPPPTFYPPQPECAGRKLGTYTWSQEYWRFPASDGLSEFLNTEEGRSWNCGDVTVNIGDSTNVVLTVPDQTMIVNFAKKFRAQTGNRETLWFSYWDIHSRNGQKMVDFVGLFKGMLERSVTKETMAEIGPIGLSFDIANIDGKWVKEALVAAQEMKADLMDTMGYPEGSVLVQHVFGALGAETTEYVMTYADSALLQLYRNDIKEIDGTNPDDLFGRLRYMLTDQCEVCTGPDYKDLKAKITIMVEAVCTGLGKYCSKLSMCAFDAYVGDDKKGGITYLWDTVQTLDDKMVENGILTQDQYDHLFTPEGTHFSVHDWEWSKCFYGDEFSDKMGYMNDQCIGYHSAAEKCRA